MVNLKRLFRVFNKGGSTAPGFSKIERGAEKGPCVWAVGSGKGGVGKSFMASNLAALLATSGNRVLAIDADVGGANLHTLFGVEGANLSLSSFLKAEVADLRGLISGTGIESLDLVSGAKDSLDVADLDMKGITRLKRAIKGLDYDYVLMDLGPGTSSKMLELFLSADEGVLVMSPEPTSIENSYRFLKSLYLWKIRKILRSNDDTDLKGALKTVIERGNHKIKTVSDILNGLRKLDDSGRMLGELMGGTRVSIVINQKTERDAELGPLMSKACCDYFGLGVFHAGDVCHSPDVTESIRARKPLVLSNKDSAAAGMILTCFGQIYRAATPYAKLEEKV